MEEPEQMLQVSAVGEQAVVVRAGGRVFQIEHNVFLLRRSSSSHAADRELHMAKMADSDGL